MLKEINNIGEQFIKLAKEKSIVIISKNNVDGILSAAIISKTIQRINKQFSLQILDAVDAKIIEKANGSNILFILELNTDCLKDFEHNSDIFVINHEKTRLRLKSPSIRVINPYLFDEEDISSSVLSYLFSKAISQKNKDLADFAIQGMLGDGLESSKSRFFSSIIKESGVKIKEGLLVYPATRPLHKALENSLAIFIPEITGLPHNASKFLSDAGIYKGAEKKCLAELTSKEMETLTAEINAKRNYILPSTGLSGQIYLSKEGAKMEDLRESVAIINACIRNNQSHIAFSSCIGSSSAKKQAEKIYIDYRQSLLSAIQLAESAEKTSGKDFAIINLKDKVKSGILSTVTDILADSSLFPPKTVLITMAKEGKETKIEARKVGKKGRNIQHLFSETLKSLDETFTPQAGEEQSSASFAIKKENEEKFLALLSKNLENELVKV